MNLLHLDYFREVANSEHVQKTGEKLHVSPSAVSAGIRSLERELGVELFDRVGRNMRLNQAGRAFLPYVEQAFQSLQAGVEAIQAARGRSQNTVRLAMQDAMLWTQLLQEFQQEHPEIRVYQLAQDPDPKGRLLEQERLDFIVSDLELDNPALDHCDLFRDKLIVAVPKSHPLAGRTEPLSLWEFQDDVFLFRPKSDLFQQYVDRTLEEIGFRPSDIMVLEYSLRYRMLEAGAGVIITTHYSMGSEPSFGRYAAFLKIREFAPFSLVKKLYWRKSPPLSPSARLFRQALEAYLDRRTRPEE